MSKLNDEIKPWLLVNGFKEIDGIPRNVTHYTWDYQYHNSEYFVYFDEGETCIKARYHNDTSHALWLVSAEQVIAYFTKHGKAPESANTQQEHQKQNSINDTHNNTSNSITRQNIRQVIYYNKTLRTLGDVDYVQLPDNNCIRLYDKYDNMLCDISLNNPSWLQYIELFTGKLLPLQSDATVQQLSDMLCDYDWQNLKEFAAYITNNNGDAQLSPALSADNLPKAAEFLEKFCNLLVK